MSAANLNLPELPYPGLRPFAPEESAIFFGRQPQIFEMLKRLRSHRFLAVIGPSGCGKSSLVRAGLLPTLQQGLLRGAGRDWRMVLTRPGKSPFENLANAWHQALARADAGESIPSKRLEVDPSSAAFTESVLRSGGLGFVEAVADASIPDSASILLLIDQFEEIFRFRRSAMERQDAAHVSRQRKDAAALVNLIQETVQQTQRKIYVMLTMRSDFLGDCDRFLGLPEAINDSQFLTPRMTREQLRKAVEEPAKLYGAQVEQGLVNSILNDVGTDPDQLPLMQHALMRVWLHARDTREDGAPIVLHSSDYEAVGGVRKALGKHADETFEGLNSRQQRIAEVMFRCLSDGSESNRDLRRPTPLAEVGEVADVKSREVAEVVEVFRQPLVSFLMPPKGVDLKDDTVLDVSHESLIRQWDRLGRWLDEESKSAEIYKRLTNTASLWSRERAGLWGTPDVEIATEWREHEAPTTAWAKRYGGDFSLSMKFLDESLRDVANKQRQREEQQRTQRELELARKATAAEKGRAAEAEKRRQVEELAAARMKRRFNLAVVALAIAFVMALISWHQTDRAKTESDRAQTALGQAKAAETQATAAKSAAEQAATTARNKERIARSERLALLANSVARQFPQRQVLLAVEAVKAAGEQRVLSAEQALRDAIPPVVHLPYFSDAAGGMETQGSIRITRVLVPEYFANRFLSQDLRGIVVAWEIERDEQSRKQQITQLEVLTQNAEPSAPPQVTSDGRFLAVAETDSGVKTWDLSELARPPFTYRPRSAAVKARGTVPMAVSNERIAACQENGTVWIYDIGAGVPVRRFPAGKDPVIRLAFRDDGKSLAGAQRRGNVLIWNLRDERDQPRRIGIPQETNLDDPSRTATRTLTFVPGGRFLIWLYADGQIYVWDFELEEMRGPLLDRRFVTNCIAVSHDGQWLAAGTQLGTTYLWRIGDSFPDSPGETLSGHEGTVLSLAFGEHAPQLASTGQDGTVRLRRYEDGQWSPALILRGSGLPVTTVAISADWVIAGAEELMAYTQHRDFLLAEARRISTRNFTPAEWNQYFPDEEYRETFPGLPTPLEIVDKSDSSIRYFIRRLPKVPSADPEVLIAEAWKAWQAMANITVVPVESVYDANVVLTTGALDAPGMRSTASIGPPTDLQLEVLFNTNVDWDAESFRVVATHEFGHVLGLRHTNTPRQLMSTFPTEGITTPQGEDIARVQQIWGVNTSTVQNAGDRISGLANVLIDRWNGSERWETNKISSEDLQKGLRVLIKANLLNGAALDRAPSAQREKLATEAIENFQRLDNIEPDGIFGKNTLERLSEYWVCTSTRANSNAVILSQDSMARVQNELFGGPVPVILFVYLDRETLDQLNIPLPDRAINRTWDAFDTWTQYIDLHVKGVSNRDDANVVITASSFTSEIGEVSMGHADVAGPRALGGQQVNIVLNLDAEWTDQTLASVLAHHIGHLLGLEHDSRPGQLMQSLDEMKNPILRPTGNDLRRIQSLWSVMPAKKL